MRMDIFVYYLISTLPCVYGLFLESIKPVSSIILNDEYIKEIINHENISSWYLKQISSLFVVVYKGMHSRSTCPILRTTYANNFLFSWVKSCENV